MSSKTTVVRAIALAVMFSTQAIAQTVAPPDSVQALVDRLDLGKYKATIKGLTQFGDRREGTDRNRAAVDWIAAQFKSYGCTNVERLKYDYRPEPAAPAAAASATPVRSVGGGRPRGMRTPTTPNNDPNA